jgi:hypothetical protein
MHNQASVEMICGADTPECQAVSLRSTMTVCTGSVDDARLAAWDENSIEDTTCSCLTMTAQIACTPAAVGGLSGAKRGRSVLNKDNLPLAHAPDAASDTPLSSCNPVTKDAGGQLLRTPPKLRRLLYSSASRAHSPNPLEGGSYTTPEPLERDVRAIALWAPSRIAQSPATPVIKSSNKPRRLLDFDAVTPDGCKSEQFRGDLFPACLSQLA